jgi:hypothetical protein
MMTQSTLLMFKDCRPVCDIKMIFVLRKNIKPPPEAMQAANRVAGNKKGGLLDKWIGG